MLRRRHRGGAPMLLASPEPPQSTHAAATHMLHTWRGCMLCYAAPSNGRSGSTSLAAALPFQFGATSSWLRLLPPTRPRSPRAPLLGRPCPKPIWKSPVPLPTFRSLSVTT
eukprot:362606-Chlamydomonas_euryale.AAC.5